MTIHQHPQDTHALATPANSRRSTSPALRIEKLRTRAAPLDMTSDQFRSLGHDLVDRIADFLASIGTHPVTRAESPEQVRAALAANRVLPQLGGGCGVFESSVCRELDPGRGALGGARAGVQKR